MRWSSKITNSAAAVVLFFAFAACDVLPLEGLFEMGEAQFGMRTDQEDESDAVFEMRHGHDMAALDLSAEQQGQIDALKAVMQDDLADEYALMQQLRAEMLALWTAEQPDRQDILDKHAEMNQVRDRIVERRFALRLEVLALLTAEQRETHSGRACAHSAAVGAAHATCSGGQSGREGHDGMSGDKGNGGCGGRGMQGKLDLSADQRSQIMSLKAEMQEDLTEVKADLLQLKVDVCELWGVPEPDVEAILEKRNETQPHRQEILSQRIEFRLAVLDLLTPEQQSALVDLINSRQEGRSGGCRGSSH